jgi:hypothetical protein
VSRSKYINFPIGQGALDYLCSIYAVINAFHLQDLLTDVPGLPDGKLKAAEELFEHLLERINKKGNLFLATTQGIDPEDIPWLITTARNSPKGRKGTPLPQFPAGEYNFKDMVAIRSHLKSQSKAAAIIFFRILSDGFTHYTVVKKINDSGDLVLFDSYGFETIADKDGKLLLKNESVEEAIEIENVFLL